MAARPVSTPADTQLLLFSDKPAPAAGDAGTVTPVAGTPPPGTLEPARFAHPQANRGIVLGGHAVAYALKRARRRSIGFIVGHDGLSVNAPKWVGIADIEAALREKAGWILRKLADQRERQRRLQSARVDWRDGTVLPFLGDTLVVMIDPRAVLEPGGAVLHRGGDLAPPNLALPNLALPNLALPNLALRVGLPPDATPQQLRDAVLGWLQRQARQVFEARCQHFSRRLGVQCTRLSLSSAQTRWGSASADGSIRLNWRLVHLSMPTIDYVVVHELAHLREMNHSPRFWDVVRTVLPDYQRSRAALKDGVLPAFE